MDSRESPFLAGERLYLRALHESDAAGSYPSWFNNEEVCQGNSHHVFPYTTENALSYIRFARDSRDDLILAIVLKEDHRHIGNIALQAIHPVNRSAELAIVIGDDRAGGHGYGREATLLIFKHGFEELNLHRIGCGTFENNASMKSLAASLGMREEGRRKQAAFKNGKYLDIVEYGMLRNEFREFRCDAPPL